MYDDDKKPKAQSRTDSQGESGAVDDLDEGVHEIMDEFDLDEAEANKVKKLEDEGYDEEDAVAKAQE